MARETAGADANGAPAAMTPDAVGRGAGPSERRLPLDSTTAVLVLIVLALLLRAFVAGVWLPFSGFRIDIGDWAAWAGRLGSTGPFVFYDTTGLADYPPAYMYVLWAIGSIGNALRPFLADVNVSAGLVKIPGMLADAGVGWLLFLYARRYADGWLGSSSGERLGVVVAALYLFNPASIFNSAVWGQVDSVGALVILATLYVLARGWTEAAAIGAAVALLVKFQYGFMIPLVAVVGLKRHLFGRSSDPEQDGKADWLRVLTSLAAGLGTLVAMMLPFGMTLFAPGDPRHSLWDKFFAASETYKGLSLNAFNLWRNPWSGLGDTQQWGCDAPQVDSCVRQGIAFTLGDFAVTWQLIGLVLFGLAALVALYHVARRDDPRGLLIGTLVLAMAFFTLPTRIHERYLFPAIVLAGPLIRVARGWAVLFGVLSASVFLNVYWTYTADYTWYESTILNPGIGGLPMQREPLLAVTLFTDYGIYALSLMIVVALAWVLAYSLREAGAHDEALLAPMRPTTPMPAELAPVAGTPTWEGVASERTPAADAWRRFRAWLRPDPGDPFVREPARRLDRLDLLLVVGFVLLALVFRLWRLELPRSTHFDEVYHARSATEWLANWQNGWTRDTYEWTHPPLAKYLIAAGIELGNPNQLVGHVDVDAPVTSLAIVPQRTAYARVASVIFTGDGSTTITARESLSGTVISAWEAPGPVRALAYDEDSNRLLVGVGGSGTVTVYDLYAFTAVRGERGPPPAVVPIETGLGGVEQIVVPPGEPIVLFRGPDGIVEVERVTGIEIARNDAVVSDLAWIPAFSTDTEERPTRVVAVDPSRSRLLVFQGSSLQPDRDSFREDGALQLTHEAAGSLLVAGNGKDLKVWLPVGALPADDEHGPLDGGLTVFDGAISEIDTAPLPGRPIRVGWNHVANIMYVTGTQSGTGDPVVWTVQPRGNGGSQSVGFVPFDTTVLSGAAGPIGFDVSDHAEGDDHERLVVATSGPDGNALEAVDVGSNNWAWRLAGVIFGSIMVGLIYLLAATMFSRRRIAVLAAVFVCFDGMSYVMSRISMNDIFVATFIVAAYLVFWQVWSGRWARGAWWGLPLVGVLLGLAAASKWVGWYALAGILVLVLARSALGRFLLVAGVGFLAIVAGLGAPWPFLVVALGALLLALVITWHRPLRLEVSDLAALGATGLVGGGIGLAFAMAYSSFDPTVVREPRSTVELVFGLLARGAEAQWPAYLMLAVAAILLLARAVYSLFRPESDRRWWVPGELGGFAWPWALAALVVVPLTVYFITFIPYLQLGHTIAISGQGPGYGWSLDELHSQMFGYHFGLTAGHAAASPWWSWPLDLKPTWFYSHNFDRDLLAVIYNGGNPILFWAGVPAIVLGALLAWKRRSLALVLLVGAFAFQYLPWTRIERATFHYHYFTAVLFAMVAVAYLVDEGLRSWAWRSLTIAFGVAALVAGVLIFPLGAALAMPDWYINAARALAPWNYGFQFPNPPTDVREPLLTADTVKLAIGTAVSLAAAFFALGGGRDLLARLRPGGEADTGSAASP